MMEMTASRFTLVCINWGFFFNSLEDHMYLSTWDTSHTNYWEFHVFMKFIKVGVNGGVERASQ